MGVWITVRNGRRGFGETGARADALNETGHCTTSMLVCRFGTVPQSSGTSGRVTQVRERGTVPEPLCRVGEHEDGNGDRVDEGPIG